MVYLSYEGEIRTGVGESELGELWRTGSVYIWGMLMGLQLAQAAAQGL